MIQLFAVNIRLLEKEECYENCYLRSSKERKMQADTLKMPEDKARCIAAGLLLEYAYKKFRTEYIKELARANSFGYAPERDLPEELPEIKKDENGKPYFSFAHMEEVQQTEKEGPIYFNLSHSGNYVICAMADRAVGADIQKRTRIRESLVRRFFNPEEKRSIEECASDDARKEKTFAGFWAVREAEVKLSGRGIGQLLDRNEGKKVCEITSADAGETADLKMLQQICKWNGWIEEEYAWAVVCYPQTTPDGKTEPDVLEPVTVDGGELFYEREF